MNLAFSWTNIMFTKIESATSNNVASLILQRPLPRSESTFYGKWQIRLLQRSPRESRIYFASENFDQRLHKNNRADGKKLCTLFCN